MGKVKSIGYTNFSTSPMGKPINVVSYMASHGNKQNHTSNNCHKTH